MKVRDARFEAREAPSLFEGCPSCLAVGRGSGAAASDAGFDCETSEDLTERSWMDDAEVAVVHEDIEMDRLEEP
jgi:hypothetical protein